VRVTDLELSSKPLLYIGLACGCGWSKVISTTDRLHPSRYTTCRCRDQRL